MVRNRQVILRDYLVSGSPKESDMKVVEGSMELKVSEGSNQILLKNLYLSCDPDFRHFMTEAGLCGFSFTPASPIFGYGVAKVVESEHPDYKKGDFVWGSSMLWEEYSLVPPCQFLFKIDDTNEFPLSYYAGILGMPGMVAYVGLFEVGCVKKGDNVFVSAASGGVGHIVGQFAKLCGCYVVGSAGSQEKVDLLKNKLGFDEAFNYKENPDLDSTLKRYFPEGIDLYFDNVGGKTLDTVLLNMRHNGRITLCGMVSQYNLDQYEGITNLPQLILKRGRMQGFYVEDHYHLYPKYLEFVLPHIKDGRIVYVEDIVEGIENGPSTKAGLYGGRNAGKQVLLVAHE